MHCTDAERSFLSQCGELTDVPLHEIQLPVSGSSQAIEFLCAGSLTKDLLNLTASVSDWNWPPVTLCFLPDDTPDEELERHRFFPRCARSVFFCRSNAAEMASTVAEALAFHRTRRGYYSEDPSASAYTINNVSPRWLFEAMMTHLDEYIYFKDEESRFLAVSQYLVEQCGHKSADKILGRTDFEFFDEKHSRKAFKDEQKIVEGKLPELHKEESLDREDKKHWVLSHKFPLLTRSGFVAGSFGLSRDITESKELQRALEKSNVQMSEELHLAKNLQKTLLAQSFPSTGKTGESTSLEIAARYIPSFHLSGDYYCVRKTDSGATAFLLADVIGHGVRAAMITAMIQIAVQQLQPLLDQPAEFMRQLNQSIHSSIEPTNEVIFATAVFGHIDPAGKELRFVQSGARHGAIASGKDPRQTTLLADDRMGTALGLLPHSVYEETQMTLHSGDEILLYTDGLVETAGVDGEEFGESRLLEWLATDPGGPWKARFDGLLENLRSFTDGGNPEDDLCLLAIRLP